MSVALTSNHLSYRTAPEDWRDRARCAGLDTELFFPLSDGAERPEVEGVLRYCHGCPVRIECLTWALEHGEDGIWGGTTARQREAMRKRHE